MFEKGDILREYVAPLLVIATIGLGSFYVGSRIDTTEHEARLGFVEKQVDALQEVTIILQSIRIELSRRGEWIERTDEAIDNLQGKTKDRYTKSDALKDRELSDKNLEFISEKIIGLERRMSLLEQK